MASGGGGTKADKMRARLESMAKEREEFEAQRQHLEREMKNSSLGKISSTMTEKPDDPSPSQTPVNRLRKSSRGSLSDSRDQLSSSTQSLPAVAGATVSLTQAVIVPSGTRVSDWAFSLASGEGEDAPPTIKLNEVYENIRNLGRGAFGDVFLVKNLEDNKMFADKTIFIEKESQFSGILRELFFLKKYRHPFIIDIYDGFVIAQPRVLHILMSYCEAGDLGKVISMHRKNKSSVPEAQVTKWCLQIALAMAFLHESGVLHRDLKPNNVMLTEGGETIKVCDFGLALETAESGGGFDSTAEAGTPYYTAPEMIQGKKYSYPTDCWSFGVMMHELLCLERPFQGGSTAELVRSILLDAPPPCPPHYSENTRAVALGFLVKDPEARLGFAGLLTASPLAGRVASIPQAYRPKALEERIKRAHVKQLVTQIELLPQAKLSSVKGCLNSSLAAAEAAAAVPALLGSASASASASSSSANLPAVERDQPALQRPSPSASPSGSAAARKRLLPPSTAPEAPAVDIQPTILEEGGPLGSASEDVVSPTTTHTPSPPSPVPPSEPNPRTSAGVPRNLAHYVERQEGALENAAPDSQEATLEVEVSAEGEVAEEVEVAAPVESAAGETAAETGTEMAPSVGGGRVGAHIHAAIEADLALTSSSVPDPCN